MKRSTLIMFAVLLMGCEPTKAPDAAVVELATTPAEADSGTTTVATADAGKVEAPKKEKTPEKKEEKAPK